MPVRVGVAVASDMEVFVGVRVGVPVRVGVAVGVAVSLDALQATLTMLENDCSV